METLKAISREHLERKLISEGIETYNVNLIVNLIQLEVNKSKMDDVDPEIIYGIFFRYIMNYADGKLLRQIIEDNNLSCIKKTESEVRPDLLEAPLEHIRKRSKVEMTKEFIYYNCPMCPSKKGTYTTIIMSSMDESKGTFYQCAECNYKSPVKR